MVLQNAAVHDHGQAGLLGPAGGLIVDHAFLHPDGLGAFATLRETMHAAMAGTAIARESAWARASTIPDSTRIVSGLEEDHAKRLTGEPWARQK